MYSEDLLQNFYDVPGLLKYKFTPLEIQIFNKPDVFHTDCTTKSDISLAKSTCSTHNEFLTY